MEERNVGRLRRILDLRRRVVGIRLLALQEDYEQTDLPELEGKGTLCRMYRLASEGQHFKAMGQHFLCSYSRYALGIPPRPEDGVLAGEGYILGGLYENRAVARQVMRNMRYSETENYGVELGPLEEMERADVVLLVVQAEQCMRIMQGYARKFGAPQSLCCYGNQAMCSDLTAKVLYSNDINLSLMCRGARLHAACDPGEMGVGIPAGKFAAVVDGVAETISPVSDNGVKQAILARFDDPADVGAEIVMDYNYSYALRRYDEKCARQKAKDEAAGAAR